MLYLLPKTAFRRSHLAASGFSKNEAPLLNAILFEYNTIILLLLSGVVLVWFCFTLRRGALRYQFSRLGYSYFISILIGVACTQGMLQYFLGVFWALFIGIIVSANDAFAYIVGRSIGRTPLIRLSPNKTLEGFIGGSVCCFLWVYAQISAVFSFDRLMCMNEKLNANLFEPVNCVPWKNSVLED